MQVKTFTGPSNQAVLEQVKEQLGTEAIILSSRTITRGGKRLYEVTAGLERGLQPPKSAGPKSAGLKKPGAQSPLQHSAQSPTQEAGAPAWDMWHKEWSQVKEHLYTLMQPAVQWEKLTPRQRVALEYLQKDGVEHSIIMDMYQSLLTNPDRSLLDIVSGLCPIRPWQAKEWLERVHIMAGPAGVGKTMTALRMVLSLKKELPDLAFAFINVDCTRGSGRLVLRHFAELSDFAYTEATDAQSLRKALREARQADCIMIDMPALPQNTSLIQSLEHYGLSDLGAALHVNLSPHYSLLQLKSFARQYSTEGHSASLVWTKLDEAFDFGALLNIAAYSQIPISGLSFGAELRNSFIPAQEAHVWRLIFKHQIPSPSDAEEERQEG